MLSRRALCQVTSFSLHVFAHDGCALPSYETEWSYTSVTLSVDPFSEIDLNVEGTTQYSSGLPCNCIQMLFDS